jgi:hypothetical protein
MGAVIGPAILTGLIGYVLGFWRGRSRPDPPRHVLESFQVPPPIPYRGSWPPADFDD